MQLVIRCVLIMFCASYVRVGKFELDEFSFGIAESAILEDWNRSCIMLVIS